MRRTLLSLAFGLALFAAPAVTPAAQSYPYCPPGVTPFYVHGFAALHGALGDTMGDPLECEHTEIATGDAHQQTEKGLAFYRKSTNTPTFTNGWEHWAITAEGLVYWTGESIDPPGTEVPVEPPAAAEQGLAARGTVTRVVDGDTVDVLLDGVVARIRVIGIDTPEMVAPNQPVECFGPEASARARQLLEGQIVILEPDPTQGLIDAFGRALVYVTLPDGQDYGEVMLREGYAYEYTFRTAYLKQAEYLAAQGAAQAADRGLWGACEMLVDPAPAPAPGGYVGPYDPFGVDRDCGDFAWWQDAQAFFEAAGGPSSDRHRLDSDNDGVVCESLPGAP